MIVDIDHLEIPQGAVILIRDRDGEFDEGGFEDISAAIHEKFPMSLIIWFSGDTTFETHSEDQLQEMLETLLDHRRKRG